jgi:hypothetical protein
VASRQVGNVFCRFMVVLGHAAAHSVVVDAQLGQRLLHPGIHPGHVPRNIRLLVVLGPPANVMETAQSEAQLTGGLLRFQFGSGE